jgi:hypothetical protein
MIEYTENVILYSNGIQKEILPENGTSFKLKELYKLLSCELVQVISIGKTSIMILDEEGKLTGKDLNPLATVIAKPFLFKGDAIVGDVILCRKEMFE